MRLSERFVYSRRILTVNLLLNHLKNDAFGADRAQSLQEVEQLGYTLSYVKLGEQTVRINMAATYKTK